MCLSIFRRVQSRVIRWRQDQDPFTPCSQIWGHGEGKGRRKMRQVNSQRSPCRCTTNIYLDRLLVVIIVHPTTPIITNLPHQQSSSSSSSWIDNSSCVFQCTETCATIWLTGWPYFFHYMEAFPESILLKKININSLVYKDVGTWEKWQIHNINNE